MSRPDVWMVTPSQLIEYMKNPVSASQLGNQPYMRCQPNPAPPTNICNGLGNVGKRNILILGMESCFFLNGTIDTCYGCPSEYPSFQNPAPARNSRCPLPDTCDTPWWDPVACKCLCNSPSCEWKDTSRPIQSLDEFLKVDYKNCPNSQDCSKDKKTNSSIKIATSILSLCALLIYLM